MCVPAATRQSVHLVSMPTPSAIATLLPLLAAAPLVAQAQQDSVPGARVHTGLPYSTAGNRSLTLDLYLPKDGSPPFAAIVLIPGERSPDRSREQYRELAKLAVTRGELAVAIIEHRTVHEASSSMTSPRGWRVVSGGLSQPPAEHRPMRLARAAGTSHLQGQRR